MVLVTDIQAQTISAEAANYLRSAAPIQIPGAQLTQAFADQLNNQLEAEIGPLLDQLRVSLGLGVENQTVGGTRVVVITPHAVQPSRRTVAGVFAHTGGFALLTGNDYNVYRMAHDLGIVVYSVDYSRSPQAQFPIAVNETFAAYRAVSQNYRKVVVAGSSAGGNLLVTAILKACRGEADPPEAAGLFTPAVDRRAIGDSYVANDGRIRL
jgi:epsilon-lactone hydrolase